MVPMPGMRASSAPVFGEHLFGATAVCDQLTGTHMTNARNVGQCHQVEQLLATLRHADY
jgi:hypothetical protein